MGDKKISNKVLPLDEPYNDGLGFRKNGSASKRQILSIMKQLQKMRPINKAMGGKVQKMKDGGKAVPVAKVKIERLKKMRDPYGESNFAHQISDGKDAYTQRVIAAMKESGQPFMYGGKVKKMRNGGSVNTTKSIQLNPKTGEPI